MPELAGMAAITGEGLPLTKTMAAIAPAFRRSIAPAKSRLEEATSICSALNSAAAVIAEAEPRGPKFTSRPARSESLPISARARIWTSCGASRVTSSRRSCRLASLAAASANASVETKARSTLSASRRARLPAPASPRMGRMFRSPSGKRLAMSEASTVSEPATAPATRPRKASPASRLASLSALWTGPLAKNAARTRPTQTERNTLPPFHPQLRAPREESSRGTEPFFTWRPRRRIPSSARGACKKLPVCGLMLCARGPRKPGQTSFLITAEINYRVRRQVGPIAAKRGLRPSIPLAQHLFRREGASEIAEHPSVEAIGESIEAERRRNRARQDVARIDEAKQAFPALAREPRQDYGRERVIGGNRPGAARLMGEHVVAIAPESAKLEAIVGKSERLATGRGDEAA